MSQAEKGMKLEKLVKLMSTLDLFGSPYLFSLSSKL